MRTGAAARETLKSRGTAPKLWGKPAAEASASAGKRAEKIPSARFPKKLRWHVKHATVSLTKTEGAARTISESPEARRVPALKRSAQAFAVAKAGKAQRRITARGQRFCRIVTIRQNLLSENVIVYKIFTCISKRPDV